MPLTKATQNVIDVNICTTDTNQTISGIKAFSNSIIGNTSTSTTLETPRTIAISGDIIGTATSFNGSSNISIPTTITSGVTITSPVFAGTATGSVTSKVIQGVTDGSLATSGYIGQVISSTIASASAVSLTSTIAANVTSISLTAGEWYVNGQVDYKAAATTTITVLRQGISKTSGSVGTQDQYSTFCGITLTPTAVNDIGMPIKSQRIVVTSTTPVYLVAQSTFGVATLSAYGTIEARRIR